MMLKPVATVLFVLIAGFASGQAQPVATMKQLMVDLIHPSSNDILLFVARGGSENEREWAALRHSAVTLAESGNLLIMRRPDDRGDWMKDATALVDVGTAAYKAAQAKDMKALAALAGPLDASCTTCHKHFRPNVFPRDGGSR
jgi:cytochrome c556